MGVQISNIVAAQEIQLNDLSGKKIAVDAYNTLYQFLTIIRDRMTGEPLKDSKGRVTSHLSGLFYRTTNLLEAGIKPVFVFDGEPPDFKKRTLKTREEAKEVAKKKWKEAVERGEEAITYAQAAAKLTNEMVESSKKLLDYMGIPWVQAPSEGEAQCAFMAKREDVWAAGSQDFDSLLFGSPKLVRNLSITGKRKVPKKEIYIDVNPEIIELDRMLKDLGINQNQLIIMGILVGTDYNPDGVKGFGPKRSLELVKEVKSLSKVISKVKLESEIPAEEIFKFFLKPPATEKYELEWRPLDAEKLLNFMVSEHDFSEERISKVISKLQESFGKGTQASLKGFLGKK
jgi:flap endonuclease-1